MADIRKTAPSSSEVMAAVRTAIAATERQDYESALRLFTAVYGADQARVPDGLSYYGLCLAKVEKKFNIAIKSCKAAIDMQFYEPAHYLNLIDVYLTAGSRKKAVEVLETALARLPDDSDILTRREVMGFRARPVITSLHRDNALNVWAGRLRSRSRRLPLTGRQKMLVAGGVGVAGVILMLWIVLRNV